MRQLLTALATALIAASGIGASGLAAQTAAWKVYTTSNSDIPFNAVWAITVDADGDGWMACQGLTKFDGTTWRKYGTITTLDVSHDSKGNIWCASDLFGGSVTKFDGTTKTNYKSDNSGLQSDWVTAITVDSNDVVWIGCTFGGVSRFDGTTWTNYLAQDIGVTSIGYIRAMRHSGKALWVGSQSTGLFRFDGTTWTNFQKASSGLPSDDVFALAYEKSGKIWAGTEGAGVASFDGTTWRTFDKSNSGLPNDTVSALVVDAGGVLWAGTNAGLARFDGTAWTVYTTANSELPGNQISGLATDAQGRIWIGTAGLAIYSPSTSSIAPAPGPSTGGLAGLSATAAPNPARDMVTIGVESDRFVRLDFSLVDILGRAVARTSRELGPGRSGVSFETGSLAPGLYHCIISDGTGSRGVAVVIER